MIISRIVRPLKRWEPPGGISSIEICTTTGVSRWSIWCMPPEGVVSIAIPVPWPIWADRSSDRAPLTRPIAEMESIDNNRLFIVDNSLAQNTRWEKDLFREMIPLKKKWCSHPIEDDPRVLDLAARAGAWYVYQAVFDTSDYIRDRIRRYHDHGILVEGTILLGLDHHTEDYIRKLVDFLLEIDLDLAEFTVLTPFPHTKVCADLEKQNRILSLQLE